MCFHCGNHLVDWQPSDRPFEEHGYWFPNCVYIRYIKGPAFQHECLKYRNEHPIGIDLNVPERLDDVPEGRELPLEGPYDVPDYCCC